MNMAIFKRTWDGVNAENRFQRSVILGLIVTNVITAGLAWRTERSVVLVPPDMSAEVELTRNAASSRMLEAWGLYLAELLGNVTPQNADFIKQVISPLLAAEIYRSVIDAMEEQIKDIKLDHVTTSFKPQHVLYEPESRKCFVSGDMNTVGPNGKGESRGRTYEFVLSIRNYRPRLEHIDVYQDEPRTLDRLKQMQQTNGASS
jgi:conjugal transfer pilus assembly protein TraE